MGTMKRMIGFLLVAVMLSWLIGCSDNPNIISPAKTNDSSSVDPTNSSYDFSVPMVSFPSSQKISDGIYSYKVKLARRAYLPAIINSNASLMTSYVKDWEDWRNGNIGSISGGVWIFEFTAKNGKVLINFTSESGKWAQLDSLKETGFFEASSTGGNLAIDCENGNVSPAVSGNTIPAGGSRDTLFIIERITADGKTVHDTVFHDSLKNVKTTDTVTVILGDIVKTEGDPVDVGNGYWKNIMLFGSPIVVKRDSSYVPFGIGLPSWNSKDSLGILGAKRSDGYYPLTVVMKDGRRLFCAGGDFKKAWADSSILSKNYWGKKTPTGWVMELVQKKGHILPGSLVDTLSVPTVVVHDTVTLVKATKDTITLPGKTIFDTLFIVQIKDKHDTVHARDTVTNVLIKVVRDTIKIPGKIIIDTMYIFQVTHDTVHVRDTVIKVFIKVVKDTVKIPGKIIIDTMYISQITRDTIHVRDTIIRIVVVKDTVIKIVRDTITLPGKIIYDTVKVNTVTHDTVHIRDTVVVAVTLIDKGTVADTSKSFLRDTSWLDSNQLEGVITEDTIVRKRSIHTVLLISAKGDSVYKSDTVVSPAIIYQYRADTINLVIAQYGSSVVGADTVYRFGVTAKAFAYSGFNDDSVSLTGLSDASKWKFIGKVGGYFIFDAKLVGGITYHFNFVGNKNTWAQQEILLLDPMAVKVGSNCDIVCRAVFSKGLVKP